MANPFVAEIRIFGFNFAPTGWAQCNGQLLPISQNTALFSLLGTFYGGDGKSNFGLPNLEGRVPLHVGASQPGPGLSTYYLGEETGSETVTLLISEMPLHNHLVAAQTGNAVTPDPANANLAAGHYVVQGIGGDIAMYSSSTPADMGFAPTALSLTGNNFPHNNIMPSLVLNYCIAMQGIYPQRP
jgi:microcystin-dependent protein